jgi:hypothetical protein
MKPPGHPYPRFLAELDRHAPRESIGWVPPPAGAAPGHTHRWAVALVPGCRGCAREYERFIRPGTVYPEGWAGTVQKLRDRR